MGYRHCFEVHAVSNSEINQAVTIQLDIQTSVRDDNYELVLGNDYVITEPGVLVIKDDDGKCRGHYLRCSTMHGVIL